MEIDNKYMHQAIQLAMQGEFNARPNPLVGCVIVANGQVVGQGSHLRCGEAHAEIHALKQAARLALGATAYVTLEPCAHTGKTGPCVAALIAAGIQRVVIATLDPNPLVAGSGIAALEAAGVTVTTDVLAKEALSLNPGFFSRMTLQKPYVRAKLGMSLDGKVAMQNGESQWITSFEARQDAQKWRARSGAILTTSATLRQDDCQLTVREIENVEPPHRVIIDRQLQSPPTSQLFSLPGKTTVVVAESLPTAMIDGWVQAVGNDDVECIGLPLNKQHIDFNILLAWLAQMQINDLLIEAGGHFVGALLQAQLIDELLIYMAPKLLGNQTISMADLPAISHLNEHIRGEFLCVDKIGSDLRLRIALSDFARTHHDHS